MLSGRVESGGVACIFLILTLFKMSEKTLKLYILSRAELVSLPPKPLFLNPMIQSRAVTVAFATPPPHRPSSPNHTPHPPPHPIPSSPLTFPSSGISVPTVDGDDSALRERKSLTHQVDYRQDPSTHTTPGISAPDSTSPNTTRKHKEVKGPKVVASAIGLRIPSQSRASLPEF